MIAYPFFPVVQKLDVEEGDLMSVDGTIRVLSDQFSITLLNPELEAYRLKADKYSQMVRATKISNTLLNVLNEPFSIKAPIAQ